MFIALIIIWLLLFTVYTPLYTVFTSYLFGFGGILGGLFLLSSVNWSELKNSDNVQIKKLQTLPYPGLFLSIGILGTFYGIYEGLQGLGAGNNKSISDEDIRKLIRGLTLAFTTSIAGMTLAFTYRVLEKMFGKIAYEEPGTQEVIDAINAMTKRLNAFVGDVQDGVSSGLTEALRGMNERLEKLVSDQLGQAFDNLKISIEKLNEWVIQYQGQIDELRQAYEANRIGIDVFQNKAQNIVNALAPLPEYMAGIENTLEKVNKPIEDFANLGEEARKTLAIMQTHLEKWSEISERMSDAQTTMTGLTQTLSDNHTAMSETISREMKKAQANIARLTDSLEESQDELKNQIDNITEAQIRRFAEDLAAISEKFAEDYKPISEALERVLNGLDTRSNNIPKEDDSDA